MQALHLFTSTSDLPLPIPYPLHVPVSSHFHPPAHPRTHRPHARARFERKKGIGLALDALAVLAAGDEGAGGSSRCLPPQQVPPSAAQAVLVIAGGYDVRLAENVEHLEELRARAAHLRLGDRVAFLPSFTDRQGTSATFLLRQGTRGGGEGWRGEGRP